MSVLVKICGLTSLADALAAAEAGADYLGFVFAPSKRRLGVDEAAAITAQLPAGPKKVGIFVNQDPAEVERIRERCRLDIVQLHGGEDERYASKLGGDIIKALAVGECEAPGPEAYPDTVLLLDTMVKGCFGGTGKCFDWSLAVNLARRRPLFLAGGLNPDNVAKAIAMVRPFAVDVSSGVEIAPGRKDHAKIRDFIARAKAC